MTGDFTEYLHKELQDPELAAEYMKAALEDGDPEVIEMARRDIARTMTEEEYERKLEIIEELMKTAMHHDTAEAMELLQLVSEVQAYEAGMRGEWGI